MMSIIFLIFAVVVNSATALNCPANEQYADCFGDIQLTCQKPSMSQFEQSGDCVEGCICGPGLIRPQPGGDCIPYEKCPEFCLSTQSYQSCGPYCPPRCLDPVPDCPEDVCTVGCICKEGLLWDESTETCVSSC